MSTTVDFPVVQEAEFPDGLRCMRCNRSLEVGDPYRCAPSHMAEDGTFWGELYCVYCEPVPWES